MRSTAANSKKTVGKPFKQGESGNPSGRPKLLPEIAAMKKAGLTIAVTLFYEAITDPKYVAKLKRKPHDFKEFMEVAFDRFGLPKVTKSEIEVKEGDAERLKKARERAFGGRIESAIAFRNGNGASNGTNGIH